MHRRWVASPHYRAVIDTLKAARISAGMSQRQLAHRIDKHPSFVNKIELIERRLDVLEFIALAKAIGVPPADLLGKMVAGLPEKFEI